MFKCPGTYAPHFDCFSLSKIKVFYKIEESSIHYASEEFASTGLFSCGGKTTMCQKRLNDV